MRTRSQCSTVLGKRGAPSEPSSPSSTRDVSEDGLLTPEATPNPKRGRTSSILYDGDWNKENIPPLRFEILGSSPSRVTRSLRRTSTMSEHSTPRATNSLQRHTSVSGGLFAPTTPSSSLGHLSMGTPPPTPPALLLPISARTRALLRATCNNTGCLTGRVDEVATVQCFVRSLLSPSEDQAECSVLYISGSPGTGKTALVTSVLDNMRSELFDASAEFISINCMALNNIDALWDRLVEVMAPPAMSRTRTKKTKETSHQAVARLLSSRKTKCVLLLDELDHLASSLQSLASLFALVNSHSAIIRLIGIANTHTLTSSSTSTLSAESLRHVKTCHFSPYTPQQLLDILQQRLAPLSHGNTLDRLDAKDKFLPLPTLTLLTKKIATQTGDVRSLFEVLRGAIDIAVTSESSENPLSAPVPAVTPSHVLAALKVYTPSSSARPARAGTTPTSSSEVVAKIHNLGLQPRIVLLAFFLACMRITSGLSLGGMPSPPRTPSKSTPSRSSIGASKADHPAGVDVNQLHAYYAAILTRSEVEIFSPVSKSEFLDLLGVLETVGLATLSSLSTPKTPRKGLSRTMSHGTGVGAQDVRFVEGIRLDEVSRGLGLDSENGELAVGQEEVRMIANKERARMSRERKASPGATQVVGFGDGDD